jgi:zinc and cadmium transporter
VRLFPIGLAVCVGGFLCCAAHTDQPATVNGDSATPPGTSSHAHRHDDHDHSHGRSASAVSSPNGAVEETAEAPASGRWPLILLGIYSLAIIAASLFGGWVPQRFELTHTGMQIMVSLVGGLMLGIGVFHMLPHALVELGEDGLDVAAYGMMAGLIIMFLMLRLFHFHHHGPADVGCTHAAHHEHDHDGGHHQMSEAYSQTAANRLSWVGVFLGMTLHSLIDGLAVGASVEADAVHGASGLLGVGTFLAVVLHKPLDSVSITSLMIVGGSSRRSQMLANVGYAMVCPLGAALFVLGVREFSSQQSLIVGFALAVSAGVFLCIALSDLLPEMEFHSHNRFQLTAALLAGVVLAWAIRFVEPAHSHSHRHSETSHVRAE